MGTLSSVTKVAHLFPDVRELLVDLANHLLLVFESLSRGWLLLIFNLLWDQRGLMRKNLLNAPDAVRVMA